MTAWDGTDRRERKALVATTAGGKSMSESEGRHPLDIVEVRDIARDAMQAVNFHMAECERNQVRNEKTQTEIKDSVTTVSMKVTEVATNLHAKIEQVKDSTAATIAAGTKETNDKIGMLQGKIQWIMGVLFVIGQAVTVALHFLGK